MTRQKVKVGQEVKNKCPVCGRAGIGFPCEVEKQLNTLNKLRNVKRIKIWCWKCGADFWFHPRTGKVTVRKIDKTYVA